MANVTVHAAPYNKEVTVELPVTLRVIVEAKGLKRAHTLKIDAEGNMELSVEEKKR